MIRTVVGILKKNNKVLVAERPQGKPYSGYWEFPGGKIEENELAYDALKRELLEELGINIVSAHSWFQHSHSYPEKTVLLEIWLVDHFEGVPHGQENQRLAWVTFPEMMQLKLLEGNLPILSKIEGLLT